MSKFLLRLWAKNKPKKIRKRKHSAKSKQFPVKQIVKPRKIDYNKYIKSKKWKQFRLIALDFYNHECGCCGSRHELEVHHKTYKNLGNEKIEDVMLLCHTCHLEEHPKYKTAA